MDQKNTVTKEIVSTRQFKYSKDGVNLSFTLRVDVATELEAFKDLLAVAIQDVLSEISVIKSKQ